MDIDHERLRYIRETYQRTADIDVALSKLTYKEIDLLREFFSPEKKIRK